MQTDTPFPKTNLPNIYILAFFIPSSIPSKKGSCHEIHSLFGSSFHLSHFFVHCIRHNILQLTPRYFIPYIQHTTAKGAYLESNQIHRLNNRLALFIRLLVRYLFSLKRTFRRQFLFHKIFMLLLETIFSKFIL